MGAKDISLLSLYAPNDTVIFMKMTVSAIRYHYSA